MVFDRLPPHNSMRLALSPETRMQAGIYPAWPSSQKMKTCTIIIRRSRDDEDGLDMSGHIDVCRR